MRVALVTGATSGLGRSAALGFAREGWAVALAGRRADRLDAVAGEAGALGAEVVAVPTDVRDVTSVEALFARVGDAFGRLDVLFNNAGISGPTTPVEDLDPAAWDEVIATNVTGVLLCARAAVRMMKAQDPRGGRIINNGSVSAQVPRMHMAAYTASKHAVTGLTKALALEGRDHGIACGQIDIGNARSEMAHAIAEGTPRAEPTIDPEVVTGAVLYMAGLPLDANVLTMTVMATKMPLVGRG
ncbi:MAG: SDR family oxidoreductase [Acidimicrobiia bacterium]